MVIGHDGYDGCNEHYAHTGFRSVSLTPCDPVDLFVEQTAGVTLQTTYRLKTVEYSNIS